MKFATLLIPLAAFAITSADATAQARIFRCGNTYTNDEAVARSQGCKLVEGGNVTVVKGTRVNNDVHKEVNTAAGVPRAASSDRERVGADQQRARDNEARAILEAELKKAEARRTDLLKDYNNGQPEMLGPEHRNHQKYLDRVAEMKAALDRNESDIEGLKRELARTGNTAAAR
jgi:hypothetical protein